MTKAVVNYLPGFLIGCILTLLLVAGFNHIEWEWDLFGFIPSVGPAIIAVIAITLSIVALLTFYRRDAADFATRVLPRPSPKPTLTAAAPRSRADVDLVRDELERQLGRLIVLIAGQLQSSKDHVASLKETNVHLASATSVSELREVVEALILKNRKNERDMRDMETRLQDAKTQASSLRERLSHAETLAALDPLTSIANRRGFEQFLAAAVERSHANGTPLCLVMTDIDRFKDVNDTHGHDAGDRVIQAFANLLAKSVRDSDLVARYGGEEFALILPKTPMGDAFAVAERIRKRFEQHGGPGDSFQKEFGRLTASFGIAQIFEGEVPRALIQRADQMLYEAKQQGRNCTMIWSSTGAERGVSTG
jgi:diguanylate cyclase